MRLESSTNNIYTAADEIFDEGSIEKYKSGDPYFVELYNQLNIIFPEKVRSIGSSYVRNYDNLARA